MGTDYSGEDDTEPNLFVYDLNTFENIGEYHRAMKDVRKDFFGLDISYLMHYTDKKNSTP